jgi:hypothetical protein
MASAMQFFKIVLGREFFWGTDHEEVFIDFGDKLPEEIVLNRNGSERSGDVVVEKLLERYFGKSEIEVYDTLRKLEFTNYI